MREPRGRVKLWLTACTMLCTDSTHAIYNCTLCLDSRDNAHCIGSSRSGSMVTMDKGKGA
eukprot:4024258-Amphidinium_carterae.1